MLTSAVLSVVLVLPGPHSLSSSDAVCPEAKTTVEIEDCMKVELERQAGELEKYYQEALRMLDDTPAAPEALMTSQLAWVASRDSFAKAVHASYYPGTIAGVSYQGWQFALTQRRIHDLWHAFIRTKQSSLPEPKE